MALQASLYDAVSCDEAPVAMLEESVRALEITGNAQLLNIPSVLLPRCAALYVNQERAPFQITIANQLATNTTTPYLKLSAYLAEECDEQPDAVVSLLADESIHPIGSFAPQTIKNMKMFFNPDTLQTQQFMEDQTPVLLYYKATTTGTITIYTAATGDAESVLISIPLQQFMDTCFSQDSPFPGFQSDSISGRSDRSGLSALGQLINEVGTVHGGKSGRNVKMMSTDGMEAPEIDHVASLFAGFSEHVRTRSQQGLPVSFQITSSTGPQGIDPSLLDIQQPTRPHHGRKHGGHRSHGMSDLSTTIFAFAFGLILVLMLKKAYMARQARAQALAAAAPPAMLERPIEKKNKDYVSVPTTAV